MFDWYSLTGKMAAYSKCIHVYIHVYMQVHVCTQTSNTRMVWGHALPETLDAF